MSYDYDELIETKTKGKLIINLHEVGYNNENDNSRIAYNWIVSCGSNGDFEEKKFNDINKAKEYYNGL